MSKLSRRKGQPKHLNFSAIEKLLHSKEFSKPESTASDDSRGNEENIPVNSQDLHSKNDQVNNNASPSLKQKSDDSTETSDSGIDLNVSKEQEISHNSTITSDISPSSQPSTPSASTPSASTPLASSPLASSPLASSPLASTNGNNSNSAECEGLVLPVTWLDTQLEETRDTRFLKQHYDNHHYFIDKQRNFLVTTVISNELEDDPAKYVAPERFISIANVICKRFPSESPGTYYIPYANIGTCKKRPARGKLYDKYIYFRRRFRSSGLIGGRGSATATVNDDQDSGDEEVQIIGEIKEAMVWLEHNSGPIGDAIPYIEATSKVRLQLFLKSDDQIYGFLKKYAALASKDGFILIDKDFQETCASRTPGSLLLKWDESFVKRVVLHACRKAKHESEYRANLRALNIDLSIEDADTLRLNSMFLLPTLLPSTFIKKTWKPSIAEAKNGFLIHCQTLVEAKEKAKARNARLEELGYPSQPSAAVVDNVPNCEFYIFLKDIQYKCQSALKVIDVCYKLCTYLKTDYPPDSKLAWLLLHKFIYEARSDCDMHYPSIGTLAHALELK